MPAGDLAGSLVVHRLGGGSVENLQFRGNEPTLVPPGISVLIGGTPQEAAEQMRRVFRDPRKYPKLHRLAGTVGTATIEQIRKAGFDVIVKPTARFANHGRIIHPQGLAGFDDTRLSELARVFRDTTGC